MLKECGVKNSINVSISYEECKAMDKIMKAQAKVQNIITYHVDTLLESDSSPVR